MQEQPPDAERHLHPPPEDGSDREQYQQSWSGDIHTAIVGRVPGLIEWIQNHVISASSEPVRDGVAEMWSESDRAIANALNFPEMGAFIEDARNFLGISRSGMVVVDEKTVIG